MKVPRDREGAGPKALPEDMTGHPSWADLETLRVAAAHEGSESFFSFLSLSSLLSSSSLFVVVVVLSWGA